MLSSSLVEMDVIGYEWPKGLKVYLQEVVREMYELKKELNV